MDYLYEVGLLTKHALIQAKAIKVCERHDDILIHQGDDRAENVALNLACVWIKDRVAQLDSGDVRDSIKRLLSNATKGECPKCPPKK